MKIIENNGDTTTAEDVCGQIQIQMENINNICGNEGQNLVKIKLFLTGCTTNYLIGIDSDFVTSAHKL